MFFVLSKIVYFFLHPFTWTLLFLIFFLIGKTPKQRKTGKIGTLVVVLFFSNSVVFKEFVRIWEIPATSIENMDSYDVAIVLGGMFEFDNSANRLSIQRGGDRIWQALNLYHAGKVKKILLSGDHGYITDRGLHEAEQLRDVLVAWGLPEEDIIVEPYSRNTYENAKESVQILQSDYPELTTFLLVTSATHMRRASSCFSKQGLTFDTFSTDPFVGKKRAYHWDEFIVPNFSNFDYWFRLIKEWVGFVGYKVMGYL